MISRNQQKSFSPEEENHWLIQTPDLLSNCLQCCGPNLTLGDALKALVEGENAGRRPPGQGLWAENNGQPRLCLWAPHWEQTQYTPVQGEFLYPGVEASLLRGAGGRGEQAGTDASCYAVF